MWKHMTFCIIVVIIPRTLGQTTPSSNNNTSTNSPQDIYDLNDEDFKLWISGRSPKAWESTTRSTTSTSTSTTTSASISSSTSVEDYFDEVFDQFGSADQQTTFQPEITVTPRPVSTSTSTPSNELPQEGYFYNRPDNLDNFLQSHTLPSKQINNQLMANINNLPYPPRYGAAAPACIPVNQIFNHRDGSLSYQTFATNHRFHGNPQPQVQPQAEPQPQPQPQPLPFPGSSHHGDAFLSQHQQKPQQPPQQPPQQQQQPLLQHPQQLPRPAVAPLPPPVQHGHPQRVSQFYGHPLFAAVQRPPVSYAPAYETPLVLNYF